ncbi:MAG: AAA family ATPase [Magnetococcales bacterium]|nr:AAA family ATPase [Magnetococcales bacterium]MBF0439507.1 AAA family ATPase [Magnetococcales bacterium]
MYLDHFGLQIDPFSNTPNTDLFFVGGGRGDILGKVLQAIRAGEGFIKVIGGVGSGKTMLCRILCQQLPGTVQVALLLNPNLRPDELLLAILQEFRLPHVPSCSTVEAHQLLLDHLVTLNRNGEQALILIEEAHCMPVATLEALRLLSNLETEQVKLVQIVLFGQPALDFNLRSNTNTCQIFERINTSLTLPPLSLIDTEQYLHHRLWAAGYRGDRLFSEEAVRNMHRVSRGGIRQINLLAHKALQAAKQAGVHAIAKQQVMMAISTCEFIPKIAFWHRPVLATGGVVALLVGNMALHSWAINPPVEVTQGHTETIVRELIQKPPLPATVTPPLVIAKRSSGRPYVKPNDPLHGRILAAHDWLAKGNDAHFTIQWIFLQEDAGIVNLERQLLALPLPLNRLQPKIFRLRNDALLVYLHEFNSMQEGLEVLQNLPSSLQAGRPSVKSLERVKKTVKKLAIVNECASGREGIPCESSV